MTRLLLAFALSSLTLSCSRDARQELPTPTTAPLDGDWTPEAELAFARERCDACHGPSTRDASRVPIGAATGARALASDALVEFLPGHRKLDPTEIDALAAALSPSAPQTTRAPSSDFARGETVWRESGCVICHAPDGIEGLAQKTDLAGVVAALRGATHRFPLRDDDARGVAVWLLRAQAKGRPAVREPGLKVECFELRVADASLPNFDGLTPAHAGLATRIDVAPRSRDDDFALRFSGFIQVPVAGEWRFVLGSDDASWLWIDEQLVVTNAEIAPHRRREGRLRLDATPHRIRVVFTEARGGQSLELLWQGPGRELEEVPGSALSSEIVELRAPDSVHGDEASRERGRAILRERRCGACHEPGDDPPAPARAWAELRAGTECPSAHVPEVLRPYVGKAPRARTPRDELRFALRRDGCILCHAHDGEGGPSAMARAQFVEREDLGEEGKLPPDLTNAGARLTSEWITTVLGSRARVRSYLAISKPVLAEADAKRWAERFARAAGPVPDVEVRVSDALVAEGRRLAGKDGYACITCHRVAGHRSLGPQGMDLAEQFARLQPHAMRSWLFAPNLQRPGTRMPAFFPAGTPDAPAKVDALIAWLSLGGTMPLPDGLATEASQWRLAVTDRPRVHGAFLKGLSARCIAVATPQRVNWAYDLAHARLAWLWRGEFVDTAGTWDGRAGNLLEPLGEDRVQLPPGSPFALASGADAELRVTGWSLDPDGHPVFHLRLGAVSIDDAPRPRVEPGGAVLVRRVTVHGGALRMVVPPEHGGVAGTPHGELAIEDGKTIEVTYRW
ncbi:MAG: hypothetical protein HZB39_11660 [Planctomycetes bacterium]|nr:hypothetical protein [Planctomycetota bacterium]